MADGLADSGGPSTGSTAISEWDAQIWRHTGRLLYNEINRHFHRGQDRLSDRRSQSNKVRRRPRRLR